MFALAETLFRLFGTLFDALKRIEGKEDKILDALTDLKKAIADLAATTQQGLTDLGTAARNEIDAITTKLGGLGDTVSAADVETAAAQLTQVGQTLTLGIGTVTKQLVDETAALTAPPPPPPV